MEYWAYKRLEPQHVEQSNAEWSPNTNAYTSQKMYEGGDDFDFGSLDLPI